MASPQLIIEHVETVTPTTLKKVQVRALNSACVSAEARVYPCVLMAFICRGSTRCMKCMLLRSVKK